MCIQPINTRSLCTQETADLSMGCSRNYLISKGKPDNVTLALKAMFYTDYYVFASSGRLQKWNPFPQKATGFVVFWGSLISTNFWLMNPENCTFFFKKFKKLARSGATPAHTGPCMVNCCDSKNNEP